RGTTAVVTLEPCAHTGRTPPCADALLAAGVARVVLAQGDPNPEAAGGADRLRRAGVDVEVGVLADEATTLNRAWTHAVTTGRPLVTWKLAASLDGRSAAADGTSRWITGPAARRDVHRLRAACDAILVGTGTVARDDPRLTVRDEADEALAADLQPLRVVMGESDLPPSSAVLDGSAPTALLRTRDPHAALADLAAREVRHVWLEGGPRLAGAFLAAGLVDEVVAYVAPLVIGRGTAALESDAFGTLADAVRLRTTDVTQLGDDVRITALTTGDH
ncbi:MAG: bifunctional diaminohydroxyphosphoribosylaminopyrimidine deaminase/5-amino-6-(5-phosphoribosylamino)uracil reductase RibD, partial [Nocardioidaceae bacterium]|nr:bifunctional diaminohydroxyphosphoribosylaminopyrimidine deaminase/5-amino-6-(5-phosphoribosylamino)uracil reductase RibD [Nocardioidaceae bacterium]